MIVSNTVIPTGACAKALAKWRELPLARRVQRTGTSTSRRFARDNSFDWNEEATR